MDYQAVGAAIAAVITALAAIVTGIYTGRNSHKKDTNDYALALEKAKNETAQAVEDASRKRIEALIEDASRLRKRLREIEDEFDTRYNEMRRHAQRGWDLASNHFGLVAMLAHLLNNIVQVGDTPNVTADAVIGVIRNARRRMEQQKIPTYLEEPLDKNKPTA